jgi:NADH:ubiquinone oxidoreductase subunit E
VSAFSFSGEFAGYVRLANGKRRMILRTLDQELILKVPRELRQELDGMLRPGMRITVHGVEEMEEEHSRPVVSEVEFEHPEEAGPCIIRVCSKKNCWKDGGREVAHLLEKELERTGLDRQVRLKLTGCLDCCKYAPTIACNERLIDSCNEACVSDLVGRLRKRLGRD